ncbi:MAG: hypothetical protein ACP6KW_10365 [Candidatus Thorarchaeota archaeon]
MGRSCTVCRNKSKVRCDKCRNEFCLDHAIKCPKCGTITCIRDLGGRPVCPTCNNQLDICPECLTNGRVVRTLTTPTVRQCPECGWIA